MTGTGLVHGMAGVFAPIELEAQDIFGNYQETSGDKFYIDLKGCVCGWLVRVRGECACALRVRSVSG